MTFLLQPLHIERAVGVSAVDGLYHGNPLGLGVATIHGIDALHKLVVRHKGLKPVEELSGVPEGIIHQFRIQRPFRGIHALEKHPVHLVGIVLLLLPFAVEHPPVCGKFRAAACKGHFFKNHDLFALGRRIDARHQTASAAANDTDIRVNFNGVMGFPLVCIVFRNDGPYWAGGHTSRTPLAFIRNDFVFISVLLHRLILGPGRSGCNWPTGWDRSYPACLLTSTAANTGFCNFVFHLMTFFLDRFSIIF